MVDVVSTTETVRLAFFNKWTAEKAAVEKWLDVKDRALKLESFYAADLLMRHGSGQVTLDHRAAFTLRKTLSRRLRVDASAGIFRVTDPRSLPRESVARTNQPVLYGTGKLSLTQRMSRRVDVSAGYAFEGVRVCPWRMH